VQDKYYMISCTNIVSGSACILDYTRSFISNDTTKSISNVPIDIVQNYNLLNIERKHNEIPKTVKIEHKTEIHDTLLHSNYAWMDNYHKYQDELDIYLDNENDYVDEYFQNQQHTIDYLVKEMQSRHSPEYSIPIATIGEYDYYARYTSDKGLPIYYRTKCTGGFDGTKAELVLDLNKIKQDTKCVDISEVFISKKHNLLAYGIDYTGNEKFEIKILDLTTLDYKPDIVSMSA